MWRRKAWYHLFMAFVISRRCTATFNHFFTERQTRQQQGCQPTSPCPIRSPLPCGTVVTRAPRGKLSSAAAKPFSFQLCDRKHPKHAGKGPAATACLHNARQLHRTHGLTPNQLIPCPPAPPTSPPSHTAYARCELRGNLPLKWRHPPPPSGCKVLLYHFARCLLAAGVKVLLP